MKRYKIMEINRNSLLARYYMFMFNGKLPQDFCTLFWNTLLSIILFPIIIKCLGGVIIYVTFTFICILGTDIIIQKGWINKSDINFLWFLLGGIVMMAAMLSVLIVFVIGLTIIIGSIEGVKYVNSKINRNKTSEPSKLPIIWATIRNKYCTKIDWK